MINSSPMGFPHGSLSRREFFRSALLTGAGLSINPIMRVWGTQQSAVPDRLLVTLQLDGGVDATMLCDPKVNVTGEPKINHWADLSEVEQVGNIQYAPVASNRSLFERYGSDMLVINGVDSQTNSHETGKLFNWTGANSEGQPSISALFAAAQAPGQPLAYSVFGGLSRTAGIIGYNRFDDLAVLRGLTQPNVQPWSGEMKRWGSEIQRAQRAVDKESARMLNTNVSLREQQSLERFNSARESRKGLAALADLIPAEEDIVQREDFNAGGMMFSSNLKQQMQSALLVFQSGLGVAADLSLGGFDSHDENEPIQEALLSHLYEALNFFWDTADSLGLADRILLVIGSDFGRTNFINETNGKDHWPIGSYILMEQGAPWGNRVVGVTDSLHFAEKIDPLTLKASKNGIFLTPSNIHKAVREYLGIEQFAIDSGFDLAAVQSIPFFDLFSSPMGS